MYAQNYTTISNFEKDKYINGITNNSNSNIQGSPYWNEEFETSILFFNNNISVDKIKLRYNIYTDSFEIKQGDKIYNIKRDENLKKIQIKDQYFSLVEIDEHDNNIVTQIIYDNELKLFLKHRVTFLKAEVAKPFTEQKPNRLKAKSPQIYIKQYGHDKLTIIKKIKDFAKIFPKQSSQIKDFIKQNKVKLNNKEQVIKLVSYIEQIN